MADGKGPARQKEKTARVVMHREFGLVNCYTLESSFHGFFDNNRNNFDFVMEHYQKVGGFALKSVFEYVIMLEFEER